MKVKDKHCPRCDSSDTQSDKRAEEDGGGEDWLCMHCDLEWDVVKDIK